MVKKTVKKTKKESFEVEADFKKKIVVLSFKLFNIELTARTAIKLVDKVSRAIDDIKRFSKK